MAQSSTQQTLGPEHAAPGSALPPAATPDPAASGTGAGEAAAAPRVALVGVHGHGRSHLRNIARLQGDGALQLVALVDPVPLVGGPEGGPAAPPGSGDEAVADLPPDVVHAPWYPDLDALLAAAAVDVVVVCTPIHTHTSLALTALRAGADVLLEKPTTASLAELDELLAAVAATGRAVQVGFQTFGSAALPAVHEVVRSGEIGEVTGVGAVGTWVRPESYWTRSPWAGRRTLGDRPVVDGVVTNPLAHAVATALHLAGATTVDDVADVVLDQYRANDIEADDTSAVLVTTAAGIPVSLGLTLCAAEHRTPHVVVEGTEGRAVLDYYTDTVEVSGPGGRRVIESPRTDLLTNLLDHRRDRSVELLCPVGRTGAFMRVLDAVRAAPDPVAVPEEHVTRATTDDGAAHRVVEDVAEWCRRVAAEHATFRELGAPWTRSTTAPTGDAR